MTERVPRAELAVLSHLWKHGPSTVRGLAEALYPEGGASAQATVQKLLERLAQKDCVSRQREGRAYVFSAEVSRMDLVDRRLRDIADSLFEGATGPLLTHLVHSSRLTSQDVDHLRRLVDDFDADADAEDGGDDHV